MFILLTWPLNLEGSYALVYPVYTDVYQTKGCALNDTAECVQFQM